jgi:hypothetical protein
VIKAMPNLRCEKKERNPTITAAIEPLNWNNMSKFN